MNRKWWSFLIPVIGFLTPIDKAFAAPVTTDSDANEQVFEKIRDLRYFYSFNAQKNGKYIYSVKHTSHASHRSHASHSSHVSGSGIYPTTPSAPNNHPVQENSSPQQWSEPEINTQVIITEDVNVRSNPSADARIIIIARKGQIVKIIQHKDMWINIHYVDDNKSIDGWIKYEYVETY